MDPDKDLVLSDVHVGAGSSDAGDLHTSVVRFSWQPPLQTSAQQPPVVLFIPGARHFSNAEPDMGMGNNSHLNRNDAVTIRDGVLPCERGFSHAADAPACDADGDLILARRQRSAQSGYAMLSLTISHRMATPLRDVGMQVGAACDVLPLLHHCVV